MTKIDKEVALRLRDEEGMNNQGIADEFKVSRQAVHDFFKKLEETPPEEPPDEPPEDEGKDLGDLEGEGQQEEDEDEENCECGGEIAQTQFEEYLVCTVCGQLYNKD